MRSYRDELSSSILLLLFFFSFSLASHHFYIQLANDAQDVRNRLDYPPRREFPTFPPIS